MVLVLMGISREAMQRLSAAQTRDNEKEMWTQIKKPSLMVTTERKDQDWLRRCLVGEIKSITMLEGLEAEMENEGIRGYRLQPIGGNLVLILAMGASCVVESVERDRHLLERWFKIIRPWKEIDAKFHYMHGMRIAFDLSLVNGEISFSSITVQEAEIVDDATFCVIVWEENPTRGHSWCWKQRVGKCALSSPSVTRVADSVKSMEILGQKLRPVRQRNDEGQAMEEDPMA
ncbi:hypothetical protein Ancab_036113 [Ancistrocladus abbreviatus]